MRRMRAAAWASGIVILAASVVGATDVAEYECRRDALLAYPDRPAPSPPLMLGGSTATKAVGTLGYALQEMGDVVARQRARDSLYQDCLAARRPEPPSRPERISERELCGVCPCGEYWDVDGLTCVSTPPASVVESLFSKKPALTTPKASPIEGACPSGQYRRFGECVPISSRSR
jgi:hypothetical protein